MTSDNDVNRTQSGSEHENLSEQALDYRLTRMLDDIARGIKVAPGAVGNLLTDLANVRESLQAEVERLRNALGHIAETFRGGAAFVAQEALRGPK